MIPLRLLLKHPGFACVAIAILAIGIGANSAMFTLINASLLRPMLAFEPERMVGVYSEDTTAPNTWRMFSRPNFEDVRGLRDVFTDVLAMRPDQVGVTLGDATQMRFAMNVSANYFSVFGVPLQLGRPFTGEEETGASPVVIVSDRWWRRYGANADYLGQTVTIQGRPHTVVGVAAKGFGGTVPTYAPDFYFPLSGILTTGAEVADQSRDRGHNNLMLVGRLRPGIDRDQANARLQVASTRLATQHPEYNRDQRLLVAPLPKLSISVKPVDDVRRFGAVTALLFGLSGCVLLVACFNLANMLLARGIARRKEMAVRAALGADRRQLLGQLLTEGLVLAVLGSALGLVLAVALSNWLVGGINRIAPVELGFDTSPDWRVFLVTAGFCLLATLLAALGPALRSAWREFTHDLKAHAGEDAVPGRFSLFGLRNALVVGQVALSVVLLVASGLFGRGALNALRFDPGFDRGRDIPPALDPVLLGVPAPVAKQRQGEALDRVQALGVVESASLAVTIPFGDMHLGKNVQIGGAPQDGPAVGSGYNVVGPNYFRTLGVPLLRGREFTRSEYDAGTGAKVAIVNGALARKLWPDGDALGQRIRFSDFSPASNAGADAEDPTVEIVGIVPSLRESLFASDDPPMAYVPFGQDFRSGTLLHVRPKAGLDQNAVVAAVRDLVRQIDPEGPILSVRTLESHLADNVQVWMVRMGAILFGGFGAVALLLAMLGVYGVNAYAVARRTREIGIRLALGARPGSVLARIVRDGGLLVAVGLLLGFGLSALAARGIASFLFEVRPFDPLIFAATGLLLGALALIACFVPARRAARIDPMMALRSE